VNFRQIRAIASDFDGTIGGDDGVAATTVAALARFKASGRKLILVTGRPLGELHDVFQQVKLCDVVVAENGGLLYHPVDDTVRLLAPPPSESFVARLRERGVTELAVGRTIVATHTGHHRIVQDTVEEMAPQLEIILNTDALMVLPKGVDKASGLDAALAELVLLPASVAAIGDAENDIIFLRRCGYAVAVANAIPAVKAMADLVTTGVRGAGVEEFIASVLDGQG
jgi:hydroxymethylpyrimidine pyrophosphatase-like HAD family hydrolase